MPVTPYYQEVSRSAIGVNCKICNRRAVRVRDTRRPPQRADGGMGSRPGRRVPSQLHPVYGSPLHPPEFTCPRVPEQGADSETRRSTDHREPIPRPGQDERRWCAPLIPAMQTANRHKAHRCAQGAPSNRMTPRRPGMAAFQPPDPDPVAREATGLLLNIVK